MESLGRGYTVRGVGEFLESLPFPPRAFFTSSHALVPRGTLLLSRILHCTQRA